MKLLHFASTRAWKKGLRVTRKILMCLLILLLIGYLLPSHLIIPVKGASLESWDRESFWFYPWGESGTHKGIDIFAPKGTEVIAPVGGIVMSTGITNRGGKVVYLLGPKWRVYYFAHLDSILVHTGSFVSRGHLLGTVGNTGNASGKPYHLHFSMVTVLPYFWNYDRTTRQGYLKMFYLNPELYFQ